MFSTYHITALWWTNRVSHRYVTVGADTRRRHVLGPLHPGRILIYPNRYCSQFRPSVVSVFEREYVRQIKVCFANGNRELRHLEKLYVLPERAEKGCAIPHSYGQMTLSVTVPLSHWPLVRTNTWCRVVTTCDSPIGHWFALARDVVTSPHATLPLAGETSNKDVWSRDTIFHNANVLTTCILFTKRHSSQCQW